MSTDNETRLRAAYAAYAGGQVETLVELFSSDLQWTYLDPHLQDPEPQICRGREELRKGLHRLADRGLKTDLEEVVVNGASLVVVVHIQGVDRFRERHAEDRNYDVVTFRDGLIVALQACRDRDQAMAVAGIR
jgi:ketosteroid isomerase-like protein